MRQAIERFVVANRRAMLAAVHALIFAFAYWMAFVLRFDISFDKPFFIDMHPSYVRLFKNTFAVALGLKMFVFALSGLFHGWWRYVGIRDAFKLAKVTTICTLIFSVIIFIFFAHQGYPRSVLVLDWLLTGFLVAGLRISVRAIKEVPWWVSSGSAAKRVFILGAGDAGESLAREMLGRPQLNYLPVGFLDDDAAKHGAYIHGIQVLGAIANLPELADQYKVSEALIAIPSAAGAKMKRIVETCRKAGLAYKTLPGLGSLIQGRARLAALRNVMIEDLLRREPVRLDEPAVANLVHNKVVMVTGAGGSIGSEICRQTARFGPREIVLCERSENALFEIDKELRETHPTQAVSGYVLDIRDIEEMRRLFTGHKPSVVFHAAAHKHVPLMERNPAEAIRNNIWGTKIVADLAGEYGVETFVFISTDKAVDPVSVMGATKRIGELYILGLGGEHPGCKFVAVRFGNVLGSSGSVLPIFKKQIEAGGPITVTHPDMERFFMTVPEAVALVVAAAATGKDASLLALDMGKPIKVVDLARDLIRLSGLEPGADIEIVFTGIRPGEKLREQIAGERETLEPSGHEGIFTVKTTVAERKRVLGAIESLLELAEPEKRLDAQELRSRIFSVLNEIEGKG